MHFLINSSFGKNPAKTASGTPHPPNLITLDIYLIRFLLLQHPQDV